MRLSPCQRSRRVVDSLEQPLSQTGRLLCRPLMVALVATGQAIEGRLTERAAQELDADWKSLAGEAARDRQGGQPGHIGRPGGVDRGRHGILAGRIRLAD